jgi:hypothetical protein
MANFGTLPAAGNALADALAHRSAGEAGAQPAAGSSRR